MSAVHCWIGCTCPAGKDSPLRSALCLGFVKAFSSLSVRSTVSLCRGGQHPFGSLTWLVVGCSDHEHRSVSAVWEDLRGGPAPADLHLPRRSQRAVHSPAHPRLLSHAGERASRPSPQRRRASTVVPYPRSSEVTVPGPAHGSVSGLRCAASPHF